MNNSISVVTCSMNRHTHLKEHVKATIKLDNLLEHIVIDYSSNEEISSELIKINPKVKIIKVSNEKRWWLSRAFNFGFWIAQGKFILKIDADTILNSKEINKIKLKNLEGIVFKNKGSVGNFLIKKSILKKVNYFNEYISNWGAEDNDLISRIIKLATSNFKVVDSEQYIRVYDHSEKSRYNYDVKDYWALSVAFSTANRFIIENTKWDNKKKFNYKKIDTNKYLIKHFFTFKKESFNLKIKYKVIFLQTYLNKKYKTSIFKRYKLINYLLYFYPLIFINLFLKVNLYPNR